MNLNWLELFGTLASVVVAISLMMRNIKWLRILNTAGSLFFMAYGVLIAALPVAILNGFIVVINIYFLVKMHRTRDRFDLIERNIFESPYVELFLKFYQADIQRYQPGFAPKPGEGWQADLVLRDMMPVSLIIYRPLDEATVEIGLDYAVPTYRDYQNARYYFNRITERIAAGRSLTLVQKSCVPEHQKYLQRLGFQLDPGAVAAAGSAQAAAAAGGKVDVYRKVLRPSAAGKATASRA